MYIYSCANLSLLQKMTIAYLHIVEGWYKQEDEGSYGTF